MNQMKIVPVLLLVVMMLSMTACGTAGGTGGKAKVVLHSSDDQCHRHPHLRTALHHGAVSENAPGGGGMQGKTAGRPSDGKALPGAARILPGDGYLLGTGLRDEKWTVPISGRR